MRLGDDDGTLLTTSSSGAVTNAGAGVRGSPPSPPGGRCRRQEPSPTQQQIFHGGARSLSRSNLASLLCLCVSLEERFVPKRGKGLVSRVGPSVTCFSSGGYLRGRRGRWGEGGASCLPNICRSAMSDQSPKGWRWGRTRIKLFLLAVADLKNISETVVVPLMRKIEPS